MLSVFFSCVFLFFVSVHVCFSDFAFEISRFMDDMAELWRPQYQGVKPNTRCLQDATRSLATVVQLGLVLSLHAVQGSRHSVG